MMKRGKLQETTRLYLGKYESYDIREEIKKSSVKILGKKYETKGGSDLTVGNFGIDSLNEFDFPLTIHYDFDLKDVWFSEHSIF